MTAKSYGFSWLFLAFLAGGIVVATVGLFWPTRKEKYRIYTLREDKTYCLNSDKGICITLAKGTRVYLKDSEGPSHDVGNELMIPLLLQGPEIEKDFTKGEIVVWPAPPYIEK